MINSHVSLRHLDLPLMLKVTEIHVDLGPHVRTARTHLNVANVMFQAREVQKSTLCENVHITTQTLDSL